MILSGLLGSLSGTTVWHTANKVRNSRITDAVGCNYTTRINAMVTNFYHDFFYFYSLLKHDHKNVCKSWKALLKKLLSSEKLLKNLWRHKCEYWLQWGHGRNSFATPCACIISRLYGTRQLALWTWLKITGDPKHCNSWCQEFSGRALLTVTIMFF